MTSLDLLPVQNYVIVFREVGTVLLLIARFLESGNGKRLLLRSVAEVCARVLPLGGGSRQAFT